MRDAAVLTLAFGATLLAGIVLYVAVAFPLGIGREDRVLRVEFRTEQTP